MSRLLDNSIIRQICWRLSRRIYCWCRREVANDPETNGEYWLVAKVLQRMLDETPVFMDIGANRGNWSACVHASLLRLNKNGIIYAFEPTRSTFAFLEARFNENLFIKLNRMALSDQDGEANFYVVGAMAGTNSLCEHQGGEVERVERRTLDGFLLAEGIAGVSFVKSDTEGHDMSVLRGAERSLKKGLIDLWQFEYNHRWAADHSYLRDVFQFIADKPYHLGRLYGNGIETFEYYHPELERLFEANYVLVRDSSPLENLCKKMHFNASNVLVASR